MKILEKIDWILLQEYIDNGLIVANKHPEYDIWILNYSPKVQSKKIWDDYTLSCRGMVIDVNGNILARPFSKFKNFEEHDPSEIDMSKKYEIFEKMDGSLIILFFYEEIMQWIIASRGSFISEQVIKARQMIDANTYYSLNRKCTYLFEIIYKENRIVVDYGDRNELVLLGVIITENGEEIPYKTLKMLYSNYFDVVKKYDIENIKDLNELKALEEENREGFVVRFSDGFRVKVKFSEYIRLHGILTNVSNITVWEHLMNNYNFDSLLDQVPDEFYDWLKKTVKSLEHEYNEIERLALKEFIRIYHINNITSRKEFAMEALKTEHWGVLFKIFDKRPYDEIIWRKIRPSYSKPFKDGYEMS